MPFVRMAELEIDPAQLESYKAAVKEEMETSVRVEPGVLAIYAVAEAGNPCRLRFFERLKLEPGQGVLVDRQKPSKARSNEVDPDKTRYLDLAKPLRFPVALAADAPKGPQELKANVLYFYCSKREGWCRRGNAEVRFTVDVP